METSASPVRPFSVSIKARAPWPWAGVHHFATVEERRAFLVGLPARDLVIAMSGPV